MSAELFATLLEANSAGGPWDVETFWSDHLYFIPLITLEWRVWGVSETISMPLLRCNGVTCLWSNMCRCAVLPVTVFFFSFLSMSVISPVNLSLICQQIYSYSSPWDGYDNPQQNCWGSLQFEFRLDISGSIWRVRKKHIFEDRLT